MDAHAQRHGPHLPLEGGKVAAVQGRGRRHRGERRFAALELAVDLLGQGPGAGQQAPLDGGAHLLVVGLDDPGAEQDQRRHGRDDQHQQTPQNGGAHGRQAETFAPGLRAPSSEGLRVDANSLAAIFMLFDGN